MVQLLSYLSIEDITLSFDPFTVMLCLKLDTLIPYLNVASPIELPYPYSLYVNIPDSWNI